MDAAPSGVATLASKQLGVGEAAMVEVRICPRCSANMAITATACGVCGRGIHQRWYDAGTLLLIVTIGVLITWVCLAVVAGWPDS
jgi:ribosomal protein L40E